MGKNFQELKKLLPGIKKNVSLKNYTTFKIGGWAKYFFEAEKKDDIILAISVVRKMKLPFFILGKGSNLLVSDKEFKGLIIKVKNQNLRVENNRIITEAGVFLGHLVNIALKNHLTGLEWAIGIPGTVGGAIYGNAGAFGKSIGDSIEEIEVFDSSNKKIKEIPKKDCKFNYRNSIFKKSGNLIILQAILKLKKGKKEEIERKIKENSDYRMRTQPLNLPSAGCVFKNPTAGQSPIGGNKIRSLSAGELIERCGLKGKRIGNIKFSEKHANFIVNLGEGRAKDVKRLINLAKNKVKNKFGVNLTEEIQYLGFKNKSTIKNFRI